MTSLPPPIAPTSYPGIAKVRAKEGPKTFVDGDFPWIEDPIPVWRAVAILGGLVLSEGILLWTILNYLSLPGAVFAGPFLVIGLIVALPLLLWSYTYEALAFIGGAAVAVILGIIPSVAGIEPTGSMALGLLVAGALLLVMGLVESVRAYRAVAKEDMVVPASG